MPVTTERSGLSFLPKYLKDDSNDRHADENIAPF